MDPDKEKFSQRFKQQREALGITQKELAAMLNVKRSTVGSWESAHRWPELQKAQAAADIFNVPIGYLIGKEDDPTPPQSKQLNDKPSFEQMAEYVLDAPGLGEAGIRISELNDKYALDKKTFFTLHEQAYDKYELKPAKNADKNVAHNKKDIPATGVFKKGSGNNDNKH